MRTKYQIVHNETPSEVSTCLYGGTITQKQCCPLLTRARLMTALGVSLITTILLLLQCIPGSFRLDSYCCQEAVAQSKVSNIKTIDPIQEESSDLLFVDGEYDDRVEGGDRIHYKHTKRHLPQCIIIGVRKGGTRALLEFLDPIERVVSDYMQIHSTKLAKGRYHEPFDELVIDQETGQIDKTYKPIRRSIYHRHMEQWLRYFDLSQFHIVSGENLVQNPVAELSKVESFLGLEHQLSGDNFYFNSTKGFYCMKLQSRQKCLSDSKGREHPKISPKLMQMLRDFFRPLNNKLYDMIGINLGWKE